jgi:hypothetical protein
MALEEWCGMGWDGMECPGWEFKGALVILKIVSDILVCATATLKIQGLQECEPARP